MKADPKALREPRFWAGFLCTSFGQMGDPIDGQEACRAFGVSEQAAQKWWRTFTGWYDGILDETDGWLENPSGVAAALTTRLNLEVETHPGGTDYFVSAVKPARRQRVGDVGPHWRLPMFRWEEASRFPAHALVLALPGLWLKGTEAGCRAAVESAFHALPLKDTKAAARLTDQWLGAVSEGRRYRWSRSATLGWVSSAHWSTRSVQAAKQGEDVRALNDLLVRSGLK